MKFFTLDLSRKIDRMKFLILMMGTGVFMVIAVFSTYNVVTSPKLCTSCHVMLPEYYTWQASSHSNVARCVDCHIETDFEQAFKYGTKNFVLNKFSYLKNFYTYITKDYILPVTSLWPVEDENCLKCHTLTRQASASGDLIIPHQIHNKEKVSCTTCHFGVAHGTIAPRRATIKGDLRAWDKFTGKQQMQAQYIRTPMDDCMECHERRDGPLTCKACHSTSKKPVGHLAKDFESSHGKKALTELNACNLCHGHSGYVNGELEIEEEDYGKRELVSVQLLLPKKKRPQAEIVGYSRNNKFCVNCHRKKPKSHSQPSFTDAHAKAGREKQSSCFTCHSNRPEEGNPVTSTTCVTCHPSPHKEFWRVGHPIDVTVNRPNQSCLLCHQLESCGACHVSLKNK